MSPGDLRPKTQYSSRSRFIGSTHLQRESSSAQVNVPVWPEVGAGFQLLGQQAEKSPSTSDRMSVRGTFGIFG